MYNVVMNATDTKVCSKCKQEKDFTDFYKDKRGRDGLQSSCKCCSIEANRRWQKANRERRNKERRDRSANDPVYRLIHNTRSLVSRSFLYGGFTKGSKTESVIGCSYEEYRDHLESQFTDGMTWENQGTGGWVVDHRLPNSAGKTEEEVSALNHHRNLQPMWEKENIAKGDKHCPKELKRYLTKYL